MADNKGVMFKSVQKHAGRAKEKILQNLGKVDRTADDIFDDHLNNFNRQQCNANKLQKEFNNYIRCIRAAQTASKSLLDAISEVYEPQWSGYDALQAQTAASESLWQDFTHKLGDQVLIPLNTYTGQFPEMKKKIEKRNRKLIDYDGQRHSFQNLQANANKRKDDVKLTKGREQLEEARRTYEILNTELHDELPALYDSRILFLVTNLQTLFATEQVFHHETSKIYSEFEAIVDKLATESQRGSNTLRKHTTNAVKSSSPVQSPVKQISNTNNYQNQITTNGSSNINSTQIPSQSEVIRSSPKDEPRLDSISPTPDTTPENRNTTTISPTATTTSDPSYQNVMGFIDPTATTSSLKISENDDTHTESTNSTIVNGNATIATKPTTTAAQEEPVATPPLPLSVPPAMANEAVSVETVGKVAKTAKTIPQLSNEQQMNSNNNNEVKTSAEHEDNKAALVGNNSSANVYNKTHRVSDNSKNPFGDEESDSIYEIPEVATTTDLPPGVLYKVKATYSYVKEDVDELSFEIGDIISVIEYDDPEDQEEGWLMGSKDGTDEKGLFPANFTRPI